MGSRPAQRVLATIIIREGRKDLSMAGIHVSCSSGRGCLSRPGLACLPPSLYLLDSPFLAMGDRLLSDSACIGRIVLEQDREASGREHRVSRVYRGCDRIGCEAFWCANSARSSSLG